MNIPNFPNYTIDTRGNVFSKKRNKFLNQHKVKSSNGENLYYRIQLRKDKKPFTIQIQRLMALTYLPNPDNLPDVDHIDRNSLNNNLDNLRWCSKSDNQINKRMGRNKSVPFRHINIYNNTRNNNSYYLIRFIRNKKVVFRKEFNMNIYALEDVVKFRNEKYLEFNITIDDD